MDSVLVVSSDKKSIEYLYDLLRDEQLSIIESAENTSFIHRDYDLVIIDIPFENDFGLKTAVDISESMGADVIIVVPKESEKELESKSEKYGIFVIAKPIDENILKKSQTVMQSSLLMISQQVTTLQHSHILVTVIMKVYPNKSAFVLLKSQ